MTRLKKFPSRKMLLLLPRLARKKSLRAPRRGNRGEQFRRLEVKFGRTTPK